MYVWDKIEQDVEEAIIKTFVQLKKPVVFQVNKRAVVQVGKDECNTRTDKTISK